MKNFIIDSPAKVFGAIVAYLLSLYVWYVSYGVGLIAFVDGPRTPVVETFIGWWWLYPIAVIFGTILGLVTYLAKQKRATTFSFLFPLGAGALLAIPVLSTGVQVIQEEQARIDAFWADLPKETSDLNLDELEFGDVAQNPAFEHIFILPESALESDVIEWDAQVLTYLTTIPPDEIRNFYRESYEIFGFQEMASNSNSRSAIVEYEVGQGSRFELHYSTIDNQEFTIVGLIACQDRIGCLSRRNDYYCLLGRQPRLDNC